MSSRKTVGLVLGSGASRGWTHIGIIEALEEAKIPIDFIAGCSVGAYVGALYASGSLGSLKEFLLRAPSLQRKTIAFFANQFHLSPEDFRAFRKISCSCKPSIISTLSRSVIYSPL